MRLVRREPPQDAVEPVHAAQRLGEGVNRRVVASVLVGRPPKEPRQLLERDNALARHLPSLAPDKVRPAAATVVRW